MVYLSQERGIATPKSSQKLKINGLITLVLHGFTKG